MPSLAFFITRTCYGTWLHGDQRGSVGDQHNRYTTPVLPENSARNHQAFQSLNETPWNMPDADRGDVRVAIERTTEIRSWRLIELNVRTNHVHVIILAPHNQPAHVGRILKTWVTGSLKSLGRHPG